MAEARKIGASRTDGGTQRVVRRGALATVCAVTLALGALPGCERKSNNAPPQYGYPQQGYPQGPYGQPGQAPYGQPGYQPGAPAGPPPTTSGPIPGQTTNPGTNPPLGLPSVNGLTDPINNMDIGWLRNQAGVVMGELIAALAPGPKSRVENIPFIADPTVGEVNAFAACDDQGKPLMAITDGLLEVEAQIAQYRATDEVFGTKKLDAYIQMLAQNQKPGQPIVRPPVGFVDPMQHVDGRKVNRQRELFDEQVAFVLGHELGHHHLGHLGCTAPGGTGATAAQLGRLLSRALPAFNQPNEIAADIAGTNNTLDAGKRRSAGYKLTEGGAILTLNFFAALDQLTPATIVFGFESSHPHPLIRRPIVQQTAATWRTTGGIQLPTFPGFPGIPGFGG